MEPTYEFDLVAANGSLTITDENWLRIKTVLLEFQPARSVELRGDPPTRIHVVAYGSRVEVAGGILATVEELSGQRLRLVQE